MKYKWLPAEIVEDLRVIPYYIDEAKNKEEHQRKAIAMNSLRTKEQLNSTLLWSEDEKYSTFSIRHWETDTGKFRYQYTNIKAKELKEKWDFKRWEERLYFDIPLEQIELAEEITKETAATHKIPIAFKFLDVKKSRIHDFKDDSIFVVNFTSKDDAKRFYEGVKENIQYKQLVWQNKEYTGYNIDWILHYANGFKEERTALENIIKTAKKDSDNNREYKGLSGKSMKISNQEYLYFYKKYQEQIEKQKR